MKCHFWWSHFNNKMRGVLWVGLSLAKAGQALQWLVDFIDHKRGWKSAETKAFVNHVGVADVAPPRIAKGLLKRLGHARVEGIRLWLKRSKLWTGDEEKARRAGHSTVS